MTTPTPDREALLALADRCEKAGRQDDAIDLAIAEYGYHTRQFGVNYDPRLWVERNCWEPTGSLDDAVALVPDGHEWLRWGPGTMIVMLPPQPGDAEKQFARHIECKGATPALALCAAALKARALAGDRP